MTGTIQVTVTSSTESNLPVAGATVSLNHTHNGEAEVTGQTDSNGVVTFDSVNAGIQYLVEVHHEDYVSRNHNLGTTLDDQESRAVTVQLLKENEPFTWSDEDTGGTISASDNVTITVGPDAFVVEETNEPVSGDVTVVITEVDVSDENHLAAYPGSLTGVFADGSEGLLHTYGVIDINFYDSDGNYLQLADGQTAEVVFPISETLHADGTAVVAGDTIGLWTLDTTTGDWVYDNDGIVFEQNGELYLRGTKSHFSAANMDLMAGENRNYWNVMNLDVDIPTGEGFNVRPECLAVEFWIYNGATTTRPVVASPTYICGDETDKKHYYTINNGQTWISGYCWSVTMTTGPGTAMGGPQTIGSPVEFCQADVRELDNTNQCEHYSTNSQDNNRHCTTLSDHIGLDVQFGITYTLDGNGVANYSILTPTNMTDFNATTNAATSAGGETVEATLDEGKLLTCQSVCESSNRDDSQACDTNIYPRESC